MQWYTHKSTVLAQIFRLFQVVGGVACIIYYGQNVTNARKQNKYADSKWVFALVTASMSLATSFLYCFCAFWFEFRAFLLMAVWDGLLTILWVVVTGIFGKMYFSEKPEMDKGIARMKVAAGFDVANMILWLITTCWLVWAYIKNKGTLMHISRGKLGKVDS